MIGRALGGGCKPWPRESARDVTPITCIRYLQYSDFWMGSAGEDRDCERLHLGVWVKFSSGEVVYWEGSGEVLKLGIGSLLHW